MKPIAVEKIVGTHTQKNELENKRYSRKKKIIKVKKGGEKHSVICASNFSGLFKVKHQHLTTN